MDQLARSSSERGHILSYWIYPSISDLICKQRSSVFYHMARLPVPTPALQALKLQVDLSLNRFPSAYWKRRPGDAFPERRYGPRWRRINDDDNRSVLDRHLSGRELNPGPVDLELSSLTTIEPLMHTQYEMIRQWITIGLYVTAWCNHADRATKKRKQVV